MINIATFNIFWYPSDSGGRIKRSAADEALIAKVVARLNAHVLVFQEILDLERLESLLHGIEGHDYRLRTGGAGSNWTAGGQVKKDGTPMLDTKGRMKIACAYDAQVLELVDSGMLIDPIKVPDVSPRYPGILHLRERATQWEFTVVGVHCKSDVPSRMDPVRRAELACIERWVSGAAPEGSGFGHFAQPPTKDVVVVGDCNLLGDLVLSEWSGGPLSNWKLAKHAVCTSIAAKAPKRLKDPAEQWSTLTDQDFIDHFLLSPSMKKRAKGSALVFAFDRDPEFDQPPGDTHWMHRTTDFRAIPSGEEALRGVENLYRVSDHRPVRLTFKAQ